jgi:hypothetical protein
MIRTLIIIEFERGTDDFGVYHSHLRGEFGTPLVFRGTLDECRLYRSIHQ